MTAIRDTHRAAVPEHLEPWDLADPARLVRDLAATTSLRSGRSLLCQVARPATDQLNVAHTDVWPCGPPDDDYRARDDLEDAMRRIGHRDFEGDDDVRLTSVVVPVVIRQGRAVPCREHVAISSVLGYADNPFQALKGELLIVTPHGWSTSSGGAASLDPVAGATYRPSRPRTLRMVSC